MGMTMIEKILAAHSDQDQVKPGEIVNARVDMVLGNDITAPVAVKEFNKIGVDRVFDKERIALVPDHFAPNKDIKAAEQVKVVREFAQKHDITNYFEVGQMGIEHVLLPEKGLTLPGEIIIGADSHTCTYGALGALGTGVGSTDMAAAMATGKAWFKVPPTIKIVYSGELKPHVSGKDLILYTIGKIGVDGALYKAMEFTGEAIENLSMDGRMTMSNMAIEAGGKAGLIAADEKTESYLEDRAQREYTIVKPDSDAEYEQVIEIDVSQIEPQVAFPSLPENTKGLNEITEKIEIHQSVIGSCTNGRIEDLRAAAEIFKGQKVHKNVRCLVFPGTQAIYKQAMHEGLFDIFIDAGAAVSTPTCGPCLGGHMGILADGERAISTTNRNFVGRMGSTSSEVYLASPAVAAASAIKGYIAGPEEVK
ncbi:3-isopropylmalate/(R)-2-methylmalate dehydratase large subunit [Halanaerobium congolense]|jgi:3-isopropylmalate/(R)-2-methylmalate dehydratase large subunit|uniref:3-isopropylmalate dehydratase large subunit n=1 Tax=Halanaerobium congolense TaxID=54121 RepID=A0A1G6HYJ1_9FIRM|nr:3-isopropylmalate dehydratase large subunit [Halanaerobium congolense]OEG62019.1 MAG: 3-isopropylmalate dehydratase large subunit [Halanaerobium sp. MDAL1]PTX17014.1 3-isopropylmalate/(R)-2-methylmalate dehydratase large subunit [Halanaerobium congolense]PXV65961.1 3-isopropylmalate/(R)-2-methylmalate dehydratase large subunit [Halanaerobium congolense]TDP27078.1 3-isopropylmalate/(R)-2-methylmalate dehydratase large subunit [Halanaerobium congolense]SDB99342.1 3-isopropylmalate/(R)-2-methy